MYIYVYRYRQIDIDIDIDIDITYHIYTFPSDNYSRAAQVHVTKNDTMS